MDIYKQLKEEADKLVSENNLYDEFVQIKGRTLSSSEALGDHPERLDFPIFKGKEALIEVEFKGYLGQAFTDQLSDDFNGTIEELMSLPLDNNKDRAKFVATLNAIMNSLGLAEKNIHCKNEEMEDCGHKLVDYLSGLHGSVKIGMVGYQPAMIDKLKNNYDVRVLDLNPDNIGEYKYGVLIEDGETKLNEVIDWADILLVTGSTLINGTINTFIDLDKPVYFYGTTISGPASLLKLNRICFEASDN